MSPASIFIYGSILMDVTFKPTVFNNKPVEEAKSQQLIERDVLRVGRRYLVPMTPFPMPLTTPPDTRMYLVMIVQEECAKVD